MGDLSSIRSANRDVNPAPPGPFQDCRECVHIALFFDGTGNNRFADESQKKWSNVARLFFAARDKKALAIYPIYIAGVGTRYNLSRSWTERWESWKEDKTLGNAMGLGGDRRLDGGGMQVNDALERILLDNAIKEGGKAKKIAESMQGEGSKKMLGALSNHRFVKSISFSIFGFSRGAALARAFSNRLAKQFKSDGNGGYTYQGVTSRINFLGVFDTVASFGLPGKNWGGWEAKDLRVHEAVEKCYHFVAAHEVRFSFPVDLIRANDNSVDIYNEKVYPGVHSDVGGGYDPNNQGRSDKLARVPLRHMLDGAIDHGARIRSLSFLMQTDAITYDRIIEGPETKKIYEDYLSICAPGKVSVEAQMQRHMEQYFSYRGTQFRKKIGTATENDKRLTRLRRELKETIAAEEEAAGKTRNPFSYILPSQAHKDNRFRENRLEYRIEQLEAELEAAERDALRLAASDSEIAIQAYALRRAIETGDSLVAKDGQLILVLDKHQWMLNAWDRDASPQVVKFFDSLVHDSRTDFLGGREPFVYFRRRGVFEQIA
jgi:Skp family chaperone for outer membrane proteins